MRRQPSRPQNAAPRDPERRPDSWLPGTGRKSTCVMSPAESVAISHAMMITQTWWKAEFLCVGDLDDALEELIPEIPLVILISMVVSLKNNATHEGPGERERSYQ